MFEIFREPLTVSKTTRSSLKVKLFVLSCFLLLSLGFASLVSAQESVEEKELPSAGSGEPVEQSDIEKNKTVEPKTSEPKTSASETENEESQIPEAKATEKKEPLEPSSGITQKQLQEPIKPTPYLGREADKGSTPEKNEKETKPNQTQNDDSTPVFDFDLFTDSLTKDKKEERKPHLKETKDGVPLVIDGSEVFRIRASLGAYTASVRVKSIKNRIKALEKESNSAELIRGITTQESGYSTNIVAGSHTLFTVTEPDAKAEGYDSRQELALDYAYLLRKALETDLKVFKFESLLIAIGLSILTTGILVLLVKCVNWIFNQIYILLKRWKGTVIGPLKIQEAELLSAATITDLLSGITRAIRVLVFVSIVSVYLSFILSYFPVTKPIAQEGIHLILRPIAGVVWPAIVSYIPNLLFIVFIIISTYYVIAFTHFIFREIQRETIQLPGFDSDWSMPTYKIARFLIIAFAMILLFPYLPGAGSPAFQQVSIFLGVLFSLASTGALSHIISGVFLTYTGAFRMGDRVKISDTIGDVMEKTLLATKVKTIKNEIITIPNGLVLGNHIVNYSASARKGGLILHTSVTIGYDIPWQQVHKALIDAAKDTEYILDKPEPFVWQKELGDFSVKYEINASTEHPELMAKIYAQLHLKIQDIFHKRGIEILSPTYSAIRDGNRVTIPKEDLDKGYQAPSFNVNLVGATQNISKKKSE